MSSVYFYKDRGQKIHMGPVWDFDLAAANLNVDGSEDPETWLLRSAAWFERLFEDPAFAEKIRDRWQELRGVEIEGLDSFLEERAQFLDQAQRNNFAIWDPLPNYLWPEGAVESDHAAELASLRAWLAARIAWMDEALAEN